MRYYLKTKSFLNSYAEEELNGLEYERLVVNWFVLDENLDDILPYLRFFEGIYVRKADLELLEGECENNIEKLEGVGDLVSLTNYSLYDRFFIHSMNEVPSYVVSVLVKEMGLKSDSKIIDINAGFGEVLLNVGIYLSKIPLFVHDRFLSLTPRPIRGHNVDLYGVVGNQNEFSNFGENCKCYNLKPRCSVFSFDWLDVKFHKNDFDAVISYIGDGLSDDFYNNFFYQGEFIGERIGVISSVELDEELYSEYVECVNSFVLEGYFLYIFESLKSA